ncbi:unnamed protein product [Lactuca saligna]|uniref:Uncharacterized protein n=1 Tax=Lactuca saligna TaxID=75948 RepID=A0AA35ZK21_LACSI|nr:unnamed protein product [Lactuca saligna]
MYFPYYEEMIFTCVVSSSDEETESDEASLHPRKTYKTVFVAKLLGGIGDVLGEKFYVLRQKGRMVVPSSSLTPPSPFTGSFPVDLRFGSVFGGVSSSPKGSSQQERPTMVGEVGTTSYSLFSRPMLRVGRLQRIPYWRKTSPPKNGVVVLTLQL